MSGPVTVLVHGGRLAAHVPHQRVQLQRLAAQPDAGVGPGQREQLLDQPAHPFALSGDVTHGRLPDLGLQLGTVRQESRVAADGGQRRSKLV